MKSEVNSNQLRFAWEVLLRLKLSCIYLLHVVIVWFNCLSFVFSRLLVSRSSLEETSQRRITVSYRRVSGNSPALEAAWMGIEKNHIVNFSCKKEGKQFLFHSHHCKRVHNNRPIQNLYDSWFAANLHFNNSSHSVTSSSQPFWMLRFFVTNA